jgi:hypothetical protein
VQLVIATNRTFLVGGQRVFTHSLTSVVRGRGSFMQAMKRTALHSRNGDSVGSPARDALKNAPKGNDGTESSLHTKSTSRIRGGSAIPVGLRVYWRKLVRHAWGGKRREPHDRKATGGETSRLRRLAERSRTRIAAEIERRARHAQLLRETELKKKEVNRERQKQEALLARLSKEPPKRPVKYVVSDRRLEGASVNSAVLSVPKHLKKKSKKESGAAPSIGIPTQGESREEPPAVDVPRCGHVERKRNCKQCIRHAAALRDR